MLTFIITDIIKITFIITELNDTDAKISRCKTTGTNNLSFLWYKPTKNER